MNLTLYQQKGGRKEGVIYVQLMNDLRQEIQIFNKL